MNINEEGCMGRICINYTSCQFDQKWKKSKDQNKSLPKLRGSYYNIGGLIEEKIEVEIENLRLNYLTRIAQIRELKTTL